MGTVTETVNYDTTVYSLDVTDEALGGSGGPLNKAAQNLANRTAYLKSQTDSLSSGTAFYSADTGSANAYIATYTPEVTALTDGMVRRIKAAYPNSGPSTFRADPSLPAIQMLGSDHGALKGGEIVTNGELELQYSSALASWVLLASTGGYQRSVTTAQNDNSNRVATTAFVNNMTQSASISGITAASTYQLAGIDINGLFFIEVSGSGIDSYMQISVMTRQAGTAPTITILNQLHYAGIVAIGTPAIIANTAGTGRWLTIPVQNIGSGPVTLNVVAVGSQGNINLVPTATLSGTVAVTAVLTDLTAFSSQSKTTAGYQRFPGGLILNWAWTSTGGTSPYTVTYPMSFQSVVLGIFGTPQASGLTTNNFTVGNFNSLSSFQMLYGYSSAFFYFAIGY